MNPIELAKSLKWQDPSKFMVAVYPTGSVASSLLSGISPEVLTASITSIQLAEINTTPSDEWIAEEWKFASGRLENYQISLTLKDFDNFFLYRLWSKAIQVFNRAYPDDQKFDIEVRTATDFDIQNFVPVVMFKDCMLITVQGPNLDNAANASVAEFNITMKSSYIESFF